MCMILAGKEIFLHGNVQDKNIRIIDHLAANRSLKSLLAHEGYSIDLLQEERQYFGVP